MSKVTDPAHIKMLDRKVELAAELNQELDRKLMDLEKRLLKLEALSIELKTSMQASISDVAFGRFR